MKKLTGFLLFLIILLILLLGSYYATGYYAQKSIKNNIAFNDNRSDKVTLQLDKYHRGWFNSTASIIVHIKAPQRIVKDSNNAIKRIPASSYKFVIPLIIYHGPIIFSPQGVNIGLAYSYSKINMPEKMVDKYNQMFSKESTKPYIIYSALISFFMNTEEEIDIPKFKAISQDGSFSWKGLNISNERLAKDDKIDMEFTGEGFKFKHDKVVSTMDSFSGELDFHRKMGIWLGEAEFKLPLLEISDGQKIVFKAEDFEVEHDSAIDDGLFNSSMDMSVGKIIMDDKTYGPGVFELSIKNIDAIALAKINQKVSANKGLSSNSLLFSVLPQLPELLDKGAILELNKFSFELPDGKIHGDLIISLPEQARTNFMQLITKLKGHGKFAAPREVIVAFLNESAKRKLAKQPALRQALLDDAQSRGEVIVDPQQMSHIVANKQLAKLIELNVLQKQGHNYVLKFKIENGRFFVNGQPFNKAALSL